MAYTAILRVRVEALEAVWYFQPPDRVLTRLGARQAGIGDFDTDAPPEELLELMPDMFVEGVVAWDDVLDEDGGPLECTEANRRGIPTTDKIAVVNEYLLRLQAVEAKKGASPTPVTDSLHPVSSLPVEAG